MRKLYLHAGTPKTGTSTFQRFLARNSLTLSQKGIFVPSFGVDDDFAHHPLALALFSSELDKPNDSIADQFWDSLAENRSQDVLVSSETIATLLIERDPLRRRMKAIIEQADQLGFEVVPIVVVRDPLDYHESAYGQLAKNFMATTPFDDYLFEKTWNPTYISSQVMVPLELNPLHAIVLPFNQETKTTGIERAIISALGIEWDGFETVKRTNEGVGICQVSAALALANHFLSDNPVTVTQAVLCGSVIQRATNRFLDRDPTYKPMNSEMALAVEHSYEEVCADIARRFWGKEWYEVFERNVEHRRSATIDHFAYRKQFRPHAWEILLRSYSEVFAILTDKALIERGLGGDVIEARSQLKSELQPGDGYSMEMVESRLKEWGYAIAS